MTELLRKIQVVNTGEQHAIYEPMLSLEKSVTAAEAVPCAYRYEIALTLKCGFVSRDSKDLEAKKQLILDEFAHVIYGDCIDELRLAIVNLTNKNVFIPLEHVSELTNVLAKMQGRML